MTTFRYRAVQITNGKFIPKYSYLQDLQEMRWDLIAKTNIQNDWEELAQERKIWGGVVANNTAENRPRQNPRVFGMPRL
ncbi:unnamed protein product [Ceutorhynchus assimilis]|uniref:Uncharacterized protein n=1 Tax=Ceutorhynchus assimilis TaxID=467358 RepID=A0A9N9MLP9_9CUCU|nr:unnamed protein product [Ceutorhynchus assimilis]